MLFRSNKQIAGCAWHSYIKDNHVRNAINIALAEQQKQHKKEILHWRTSNSVLQDVITELSNRIKTYEEVTDDKTKKLFKMRYV